MIIVTGAAGFIGFHLSQKLLEQDEQVIGLDNLNDYYDVNLKKSRLAILKKNKNFKFHKVNIADFNKISKLFRKYNQAKILVNLAAQAGVRYSLENPFAYAESNVNGQISIFEAAKNELKNLEHLVYASSSSVYGNNDKTPFSVNDRTDNPVSLYAATKKSGEMIANYYSDCFKIPATGLRFFTVYGPYGRPDMAYFSFTKDILNDKPIKIFNNGNLKRDFTYIDDIIAGIMAVIKKPANGHKIYNLGNNSPVELSYFLSTIEKLLDKKAVVKNEPMQKADVYQTYADITESVNELGYSPKTSIEQGLSSFVQWYKDFYKVSA